MDNILSILPRELLCEIGDYLLARDGYRFSLTCKYVCSLLLNGRMGGVFPKIRVSIEQREIIEILEKGQYDPLCLRLPSGAGRRVIILSYLVKLLKHKKGMAIIVSNDCGLWIKELINCFPTMYDENPESSIAFAPNGRHLSHSVYSMTNLTPPKNCRLYIVSKDIFSLEKKNEDVIHITYDKGTHLKILKGIPSLTLDESNNDERISEGPLETVINIPRSIVATKLPSYREIYLLGDLTEALSKVCSLHSKVALSPKILYKETNRIDGFKYFVPEEDVDKVEPEEEFNVYPGKAIIPLYSGSIYAEAALFYLVPEKFVHVPSIIEKQRSLLRIANPYHQVFLYYCLASEEDILRFRVNLFLRRVDEEDGIELADLALQPIRDGSAKKAFSFFNVKPEEMSDAELYYFLYPSSSSERRRRLLERKGVTIDTELEKQRWAIYFSS